jgi:hypothetical protein
LPLAIQAPVAEVGDLQLEREAWAAWGREGIGRERM